MYVFGVFLGGSFLFPKEGWMGLRGEYENPPPFSWERDIEARELMYLSIYASPTPGRKMSDRKSRSALQSISTQPLFPAPPVSHSPFHIHPPTHLPPPQPGIHEKGQEGGSGEGRSIQTPAPPQKEKKKKNLTPSRMTCVMFRFPPCTTMPATALPCLYVGTRGFFLRARGRVVYWTTGGGVTGVLGR